MSTTKFTSRDLLEAQRELTIAKTDNRINADVLEAISAGNDSCSVPCESAPPQWVIDALKELHPDWELSYDSDNGAIKVTISTAP